jgi:hypothetical protein
VLSDTRYVESTQRWNVGVQEGLDSGTRRGSSGDMGHSDIDVGGAVGEPAEFGIEFLKRVLIRLVYSSLDVRLLNPTLFRGVSGIETRSTDTGNKETS